MASNRKNPRVVLDVLAEFMAEQTERMSDDELLEEARDAGGPKEQLAGLRRILEERAECVSRERLAMARAKYEAAMAQRASRTSRARPPLSEIRKEILQVFTNRGEMALAVAWRNGDYQSDQDLLSLWDQLCDLGAIEGGVR